MSERFPGLVIHDWQTRLVNDHDRVFPDARLVHTRDGPALACSGWPSVPEGWRNIVETACERLEIAIAAEPAADFIVIDMREKFGAFRLTVSSIGLSDEAHGVVTLAVDLAEARSICICDVCGRRGRLSEQGGWYATRCEEHSEALLPIRARDPHLQITTQFIDGQPVRTGRRYVFETDSFLVINVPPEKN